MVQRLFKKLGTILQEGGLITDEQLQAALQMQRTKGMRLGEALINLGFVTEKDIHRILGMQLGIPYVTLNNTQLDPQAARVIPEQLAKRYSAIPLKLEGKKLLVATSDPLNVFGLNDIAFTTGLELDLVIMSHTDVERAIRQAYSMAGMSDKNDAGNDRGEDELLPPAETEREAPIIRMVNTIIEHAVGDRASDIHIEPQDDTLRVRNRIDGMLYEVMTLPENTLASLVSRVKIMGNMDIAEKRIPQDGRIRYDYKGREIDIRVATLPTITGEKVVMRILDRAAATIDLDRLGFSKRSHDLFAEMIKHPYGLILVTGPTGSGKTTTLYSALNTLNASSKNIITLEDPVEYRMPGINQVQINQRAGLTFATGLRSVVRQDPNIIMVGEIRDAETAEIAIQSALTGHLVLSTVHTNDAPSTITRLVDMGVEPFLIASSTIGVIAQRLVRVICPHCREAYAVEPGSQEYDLLGLDHGKPVQLYRGKGCANCNGSGYRGRIGIFELLAVNNQLREMIQANETAAELRREATKTGMRSLRDDGLEKVLKGVTTLTEVLRVTSD